jgi:hypothetical protein
MGTRSRSLDTDDDHVTIDVRGDRLPWSRVSCRVARVACRGRAPRQVVAAYADQIARTSRQRQWSTDIDNRAARGFAAGRHGLGPPGAFTRPQRSPPSRSVLHGACAWARRPRDSPKNGGLPGRAGPLPLRREAGGPPAAAAFGVLPTSGHAMTARDRWSTGCLGPDQGAASARPRGAADRHVSWAPYFPAHPRGLPEGPFGEPAAEPQRAPRAKLLTKLRQFQSHDDAPFPATFEQQPFSSDEWAAGAAAAAGGLPPLAGTFLQPERVSRPVNLVWRPTEAAAQLGEPKRAPQTKLRRFRSCDEQHDQARAGPLWG